MLSASSATEKTPSNRTTTKKIKQTLRFCSSEPNNFELLHLVCVQKTINEISFFCYSKKQDRITVRTSVCHFACVDLTLKSVLDECVSRKKDCEILGTHCFPISSRVLPSLICFYEVVIPYPMLSAESTQSTVKVTLMI